ncbi:hypothetical protein MRX96_058333 [Rhipicephalus microplus]
MRSSIMREQVYGPVWPSGHRKRPAALVRLRRPAHGLVVADMRSCPVGQRQRRPVEARRGARGAIMDVAPLTRACQRCQHRDATQHFKGSAPMRVGHCGAV